MAIKQCAMFLDGASNEGDAQVSWQAGTQPSRFQMKFTLGQSFPQIGTIRLTDGRRSIAFPRCRVVREVVQSSGGGRMRLVTLEDRRWEWQQAKVWGVFNQDDKGAKTPVDRKSARELGEICLLAMGEQGFDIRALPADSYPAVNWDAENAASALDSICSQFGCVATLSYRTNRARVWRNNDGVRPRATADAMDGTPANEPQVVPPELIFEGGPTLWLADIPLEPVGIETSENRSIIKPIDQLSYRPAQGWGNENPASFIGASPHQDLARRSVWRMWRVQTPITLEPPPHLIGNTTVDLSVFSVAASEAWRILPLETRMPSAAGLDADGSRREAQLLGAFAKGKSVRTNNTTAANFTSWSADGVSSPSTAMLPFDDDSLLWTDGFSIDSARGIVATSAPCYWLDGGEHKAPALRLRTAISLRAPETRQFLSQRFNLRLRNPTRGAVRPELMKVAEVAFEILQGRYSIPANSSQYTTLTNSSLFVALAQVYLRERLNSLYPDEAVTMQYKGFNFDYDISGSVRTVTWVAGLSGGSTSVEYAIDRPDLRFTEKQLRAQAEQVATSRDLKAANDRLKKLLASQKRNAP